MKFLIVVAAILGVSMAGVPDNRGKRGLDHGLGLGLGSSLGLSSLSLPLSSSVISSPSISAISTPTVIKTVQTAPILRTHLPLSTSVLSAHSLSGPTLINSVHSAPIVKTVVSQPQILSYGLGPSLGLNSLVGLGSSLHLNSALSPSVVSTLSSPGLINAHNIGVHSLNAW